MSFHALEQAPTKVATRFCGRCGRQLYVSNGPTHRRVEVDRGHGKCDFCTQETSHVPAAPGSSSSSTTPRVRHSELFAHQVADHPRRGGARRPQLEQEPVKGSQWYCCNCGMGYAADGPTQTCVNNGCKNHRCKNCGYETRRITESLGSAAWSGSASFSGPAGSWRSGRSLGSD
ncbi:hypothetical protein VTJ83DRAFT_1544 [Remersonia thermophila]|uniref:Uncharacterized protein n=1 Tax=Remersonia thermophila TaxID=72144 RepID=A0ABR4DG90_9PEZI